MASETVRINQATHAKLKQLAQQYGEPMPTILDRAVEALRRQRFLEASNAAFAKLRSNRKGWGQEQDERRQWDATIRDGLGDD